MRGFPFVRMRSFPFVRMRNSHRRAYTTLNSRMRNFQLAALNFPYAKLSNDMRRQLQSPD
jgi:hypothetical protein